MSLVERLPKPDPAQLQRQLAPEVRAAPALLTGGAAGGGGGGTGGAAGAVAANGQGAVGSGGGGAAAAVAAARQRQAQQLLLDPHWQASLAGEDDVLRKLATAEAAEGDLEAMLLELGALEEASASASSAAATSSSSVAPAPAGTDAGSGSAGSELALVASGSASLGASVGGGAGAGFTGRVAQQMLGLQQQMSKAMQSLASLRRSGSGSGGGSKTEAAAEAAIAEVAAAGAGEAAQQAPGAGPSTSPGAGGAGGSAHASPAVPPPSTTLPVGLSAEQQALIQEQLSKLQLSQGQLASLRAMLGPGEHRAAAACAAPRLRVLLPLRHLGGCWLRPPARSAMRGTRLHPPSPPQPCLLCRRGGVHS